MTWRSTTALAVFFLLAPTTTQAAEKSTCFHGDRYCEWRNPFEGIKSIRLKLHKERHHAGQRQPKHLHPDHRPVQVARAHPAKHPCGGAFARVGAKSGASACVAHRAVAAFQGLINELEATGYKIKFMGGYRNDPCSKRHMHGCGLAVDINQFARNVVRPHLPNNATAIASKHGLLHGAVWHNADTGHFELDEKRFAIVQRRQVASRPPEALPPPAPIKILAPDVPNDAIGAMYAVLVTPAVAPRTAVYNIAERVVYLPSGLKLEAHSGLGNKVDNPQFVHLRGRGPTPPNTYHLSLRKGLFHGVKAIRLNPVHEEKMYDRDGFLAHSYLRRAPQSSGCVAFRHYGSFLAAFMQGEIDRLLVVPGGPAPKNVMLAHRGKHRYAGYKRHRYAHRSHRQRYAGA